MSAVEIRSTNGKLFIGGVELPGRCVDYRVDDDSPNPFLRVDVTLLVERNQRPAPAARAFKDDGREHMVWMTADARTTPSGKRACQTCGEAWMCSTATRRWELYGSTLVPPTAVAEFIDSMRRHIDKLVDDGRLSVGGADLLLEILKSPAPGVDKASDTPLD